MELDSVSVIVKYTCLKCLSEITKQTAGQDLSFLSKRRLQSGLLPNIYPTPCKCGQMVKPRKVSIETELP